MRSMSYDGGREKTRACVTDAGYLQRRYLRTKSASCLRKTSRRSRKKETIPNECDYAYNASPRHMDMESSQRTP